MRFWRSYKRDFDVKLDVHVYVQKVHKSRGSANMPVYMASYSIFQLMSP